MTLSIGKYYPDFVSPCRPIVSARGKNVSWSIGDPCNSMLASLKMCLGAPMSLNVIRICNVKWLPLHCSFWPQKRIKWFHRETTMQWWHDFILWGMILVFCTYYVVEGAQMLMSRIACVGYKNVCRPGVRWWWEEDK